MRPCVDAKAGTRISCYHKAGTPSNCEQTSRQHREAVTQWLVGFMAAMCSEGITDHFNFVKHSDKERKAHVLGHFQYFGSNRNLCGAGEWSKVVDACHIAVEKIFDLYRGESWLEPRDTQTASVCTKQICSLLALDDLVHLGEVFYQQATKQASTDRTEEWHIPFVWGMRMFQVIQTVRNGTSSEQPAPIPAHGQFGFVNPLTDTSEIELQEMKTDTTHGLSSEWIELPDVIEAEAPSPLVDASEEKMDLTSLVSPNHSSEIEVHEMKTDAAHGFMGLPDVIEDEASEDSLKHDMVVGLFDTEESSLHDGIYHSQNEVSPSPLAPPEGQEELVLEQDKEELDDEEEPVMQEEEDIVKGLFDLVAEHDKPSFSQDVLDKMAVCFDRYDLDGSGTINSKKELEQLMFNTYFGLSEKGLLIENASDIIQQRVDRAGDMEANDWDFNQWCAWVQVEFPEIVAWESVAHDTIDL